MLKTVSLLICIFSAMLFFGGCSLADDKEMNYQIGQYPQTFEKKTSDTQTVSLNYLLFLPQSYKPSGQKWPLMLFLHGAGERGENIEKVRVHGPPKIVENQKDFGFVVVSPQCSEGGWWTNETPALVALIDEIIDRYNVDKERIYLTGLSMGGYGTWTLACAFPERFAAIAPICGGGEPEKACRIKNLPVWAFHGGKDNVVPLKKSEEMVDAVRACGGKAELTVYSQAGHDSWTATYNNPELYKWFLKHRRTKAD